MIYFKLSWLPYILIIGGIGILFSGESIGTGFFAIAIGVIWLYIKHSKKNENSDTTTSSAKESISENSPSIKYCKHCNQPVESDSIYCEQCGNKID